MTVRITALTLCAALLPGIAVPQKTAEESMQDIASRAHVTIRRADICRQPDETVRQTESAKILAWIDAEAARVGVPASALADEIKESVAYAESRLGTSPSAAECEIAARHFVTFPDHMVSARKSEQRAMSCVSFRRRQVFRLYGSCRRRVQGATLTRFRHHHLPT
jgi:predicted protein tyrosine phosphatase